MVLWLGSWIASSKLLGGSKVNSTFRLSEIDQMSTRNSWDLVAKIRLSHRSSAASRDNTDSWDCRLQTLSIKRAFFCLHKLEDFAWLVLFSMDIVGLYMEHSCIYMTRFSSAKFPWERLILRLLILSPS